MAKIVNDRLVLESEIGETWSLPLINIAKIKERNEVCYDGNDLTDHITLTAEESESINQLLGMGD